MTSFEFKVAGVTFEGRQSLLARIRGDEACRLVPEPENPHDPNALAVHVALRRRGVANKIEAIIPPYNRTGNEPSLSTHDADNSPGLGGAAGERHRTEIVHVGYVPRDLAAQIAPLLDGESVDVRIVEVTGGFTTRYGDTANLGLIIRVELPESAA